MTKHLVEFLVLTAAFIFGAIALGVVWVLGNGGPIRF